MTNFDRALEQIALAGEVRGQYDGPQSVMDVSELLDNLASAGLVLTRLEPGQVHDTSHAFILLAASPESMERMRVQMDEEPATW